MGENLARWTDKGFNELERHPWLATPALMLAGPALAVATIIAVIVGSSSGTCRGT